MNNTAHSGILIKTNTLSLTRPFGLILIQSLLIIVLLVGLSEVALRTATVGKYLPTTMTSWQNRIQYKLGLLDKLIETEGRIDCIFLGASAVSCGINPEIIRRVYKEQTGRDMAFFNFGLSSLADPNETVAVAELLSRKYRPTLLVLGTHAFMFSTYQHPAKGYLLGLENAGRLGPPIIQGWLWKHSLTYQNYLRVFTELKNFANPHRKPKGSLTPYGYDRRTSVHKDISSRPDIKEKPFYRHLANFKIDVKKFRVLENMTRLRPEVRILLLELPLHQSIQYLLPHGEIDLQCANGMIKDFAKRCGFLFLPGLQWQHIPDEAWLNREHLNEVGAAVFSNWLGRRLAEPEQGLLQDFSR